MNYVIKSFDALNGSIVVDFEGVGRYNVDLPIEDNKYPEGEALEAFIRQFAPTWVVERAAKLNAGVSNAAYIAGLVQADPVEVVPEEPVLTQEEIQAIEAQKAAIERARIEAIVNAVLDERAAQNP
jgi:hypothetical protein